MYIYTYAYTHVYTHTYIFTHDFSIYDLYIYNYISFGNVL